MTAGQCCTSVAYITRIMHGPPPSAPTISHSIKYKWLAISSEGFSTLEKNRCDMFSEGNAAHPIGCDSQLKIVMAVWHTF
jgi:hypothetical protein